MTRPWIEPRSPGPMAKDMDALFCSIVTTMIHIQLYTYTRGNKINNNDERRHFFRKIYLSHFIRNGCERVTKGLCARGELKTEPTATYWLPVPLSFSSISLSFCWDAQSGVLRAHSPLLAAGSLYSILSPACWPQLTELPVAPGYTIVWRPPASCERRIYTEFNPSTVKAISRCLRPDAPVSRLTAGSKVTVPLENFFRYLPIRTW